LRQHALGGIAELVVLHVLAENNNRVRLDDAFEQVDHAMDLAKRLGFAGVECMEGLKVGVHISNYYTIEMLVN